MKTPITRTLGLLATCGMLLSAHTSLAQPKIAIIDLKKCFDSYWKTKQADTNLKDRAGDLDKARKGMMDDYQKAGEDYKKLLDSANDQAVASAEREKRKASAEKKLLEVRELEQSIGQFDRQSRTTLGEQQRRLRDNILKEIRDKVTAKAKGKGFSLVLDIAAESVNQTPVVIYSNGENDLSDEIISELNATAPAAAIPVLPTVAPAEPKKK